MDQNDESDRRWFRTEVPSTSRRFGGHIGGVENEDGGVWTMNIVVEFMMDRFTSIEVDFL